MPSAASCAGAFLPQAVSAAVSQYYLLTQIFAYAVAQEFLVENPMKKVPCPKLQKRKVMTARGAEKALEAGATRVSLHVDAACDAGPSQG